MDVPQSVQGIFHELNARASVEKDLNPGLWGVMVTPMKKPPQKSERSVTIRVPDNIYRQVRSRVGPGNVLNTIRDAVLDALESGAAISPPQTHHLKVELTANQIKRIDQAVEKNKFTSRNRWIVAVLREALQEDDALRDTKAGRDPQE
ncbi:MAG: hypothetical protein RDU20_18895 [Desulfomonilaceae bacterium]|nr:hypothetical protein [Desulfomonilaceae bacterium]